MLAQTGITLLQPLIRFLWPILTVPFSISIFFLRHLAKWSPPFFRIAFLLIFAGSLVWRYRLLGTSKDLHEAIHTLKQEMQTVTCARPETLLFHLLGFALYYRYREEGQKTDLEEAIVYLRNFNDVDFTILHSLGNALLDRFDRAGKIDDLNETISIFEMQVDYIRHMRGRSKVFKILSLVIHPAYLTDLASALLKRFRVEHNLHDLDLAIELAREAGGRTIFLNILVFDRATSLGVLSSALQARFEEKKTQDDLVEAIVSLQKAINIFPQSPTLQSTLLASLGRALLTQYKHGIEESATLDRAMSLFSEAVHSNSPSPVERFRIAKEWTTEADLYQHQTTFQAYDVALEVLRNLASLTLDLESRQEVLSTSSDGLARRAAAYAIANGRLDKAVEYLENGRAVFWSQVLQVRSPSDQVRNSGSRGRRLADRLDDIAKELETRSHRNAWDIRDIESGLLREHETLGLVQKEREWEKTVNEIRRLKGFGDFLRPPSMEILQGAATESPIVLLVANDGGSHCLIIKSTQPAVHFLPLPTLSTNILLKLVRQTEVAAKGLNTTTPLFEASEDSSSSFSKEERGIRVAVRCTISSDDIFNQVLRILWHEVVKPVIDVLGLEKSDSPSKLYWCPTGLFTFLPIHAAGCYDDGLDATECTFNYLISSYIPTIGSLLSLMGSPSLPASSEMMVVIQSQKLPATKKELKVIKNHLPYNVQLKEIGIPDTPATVKAVTSGFSRASIVHFACHGRQDRSRPLESGLELEDGRLQVAQIMKEKVHQGSVAFLCACETARGDAKIPDEAMNLGACLLFSGFQHVIATMWEMQDDDGPQIADGFYGELFRATDGGSASQIPDMNKSSRALHVAVKKLRDKGVPFRRWVPFIHIGK